MLDLLSSCKICPRRCGVNRLKGEKGFCGAGKDLIIYSCHLHFGEEPPISGTNPVRGGASNGAGGSGTIFFSHCSSRCVYCQNYRFSQLGEGKKTDIEELAKIMLDLQKQGAHNVNLVTPTHFIPQIITAINTAKKRGLSIPIVYNTSGYELSETLELLNGLIDIYLPDMRYSSNEMAERYSELKDYATHNRNAVKIMHKQTGDLTIEGGIAKRGLIIRHLVLPNNIAGTKETLEFIKDEISPNTYISLMSQYYPVYKAGLFPEINRQITKKEYEKAIKIMSDLGLENGWIQEAPSDGDRSTYLGVNFPSQ